jgi:hypothetical protein
MRPDCTIAFNFRVNEVVGLIKFHRRMH